MIWKHKNKINFKKKKSNFWETRFQRRSQTAVPKHCLSTMTQQHQNYHKPPFNTAFKHH
jgi:hypothetical protein